MILINFVWAYYHQMHTHALSQLMSLHIHDIPKNIITGTDFAHYTVMAKLEWTPSHFTMYY